MVVDADALAREVVEPGTPGLAAVVEEFGPGVLTEDGRLDRPALGGPGLRRRGRPEPARGDPAPADPGPGRARSRPRADPDALVVHDIPLLVETGQAGPVRGRRGGRRTGADPGRADDGRPRAGPARTRRPGWPLRSTGTGDERRRPTSSTTVARATTSEDRSRRSSRSWSPAPPEAPGRRPPSRRPGQAARSGGQVRRPGQAARSGGQVRVGEVRAAWQRLTLELADPLGGDPVLGADVGQLVLPSVDQAVAGTG